MEEPGDVRQEPQRVVARCTVVVLRQTVAGHAGYLKTGLEVITAGSSLKWPYASTHTCLLEAIACRRC